MDSLAHLGIALGLTVLLDRWLSLPFTAGWELVVFVLILVLLPDLDILTLKYPHHFSFLHHKRFTHSILFAVLLSAVVPLFLSSSPYFPLFLFALLVTLSHLLVDVLGTWKLHPWLPFSQKGYALALVKDVSIPETLLGIATLVCFFIDDVFVLICFAVFLLDFLFRGLLKFIMISKYKVTVLPTMWPWKWWGIIVKDHGSDYREISYFPLSLFGSQLPSSRYWVSTYFYQHAVSLPMTQPLEAIAYTFEALGDRWGNELSYPVFRLVNEDPVILFWYYVETIYGKHAWGMEVQVEPNGQLSAKMKHKFIDKPPGLLLEGASSETVVPWRFELVSEPLEEAGETSAMAAQLAELASAFAQTTIAESEEFEEETTTAIENLEETAEIPSLSSLTPPESMETQVPGFEAAILEEEIEEEEKEAPLFSADAEENFAFSGIDEDEEDEDEDDDDDFEF